MVIANTNLLRGEFKLEISNASITGVVPPFTTIPTLLDLSHNLLTGGVPDRLLQYCISTYSPLLDDPICKGLGGGSGDCSAFGPHSRESATELGQCITCPALDEGVKIALLVALPTVFVLIVVAYMRLMRYLRRLAQKTEKHRQLLQLDHRVVE